MFCLSAASCTAFCTAGVNVPTSWQPPSAPGCVAHCSSADAAARVACARCPRVAWSAKLTTTDWPTRFTPPSRMLLVAQQRARVRGVGIELLVQRAGHVDLQQEVHAAAQIETEVHRQRVQRGQPARRRALQVQRDDELRIGRVAVQRLLQQILHAQLRVGVRQAHADVRVGRRVVERDFVGLDLIRGERGFDLPTAWSSRA